MTATAKDLKVLMIGNSFSMCVLQHMPSVAKDMNLRLDISSLYIGGCSLEKHWSNVLKASDAGFKPYRFTRNCEGRISRSKANICEVLSSDKWDVVTLQQASHYSWKKESYHPYGDDLVAKIRELAPSAKIYVQETWSYTPWDKRLKTWGIDQNEMFAKLHEAYRDFASRHNLEIIRMGSAIQQWRKRLPVEYAENSLGGDVVGGGRQETRDQFKRTHDNKWVPNCDVFHLGREGEYFQALVWTAKIFGVDVEKCKYRPDFVSQKNCALMKQIASELR